jgi:acyl-CoA thioester hydrolase
MTFSDPISDAVSDPISDPKAEAPESPSSTARSPGPRLLECSVELEIPFHDVDTLGVVWHGHYYKYLELARTQLLRSCQLDVSDLMELRFGLVVIESSCRYVSPLHYADRARVTAWFRDVKHRLFVSYEVLNLTRAVRAARAHTILVAMSLRGEMFHRTPAEIDQRVRRAAGRTELR